MSDKDIESLVKRLSASELLDTYMAGLTRSDDSDSSDSEPDESVARSFLAGFAAGVKSRGKDTNDASRMGDMPNKKKRAEDDMDDDDDTDTKAMDDDEMTEKAAALAEERADLLVMVRDLLPSDFTARGKTNQEVLVAAVGDEVKDADKRSSDYLMAKVEAIVERRAAAKNPRKPEQNKSSQQVRSGAMIDVTRHLKRGA